MCFAMASAEPLETVCEVELSKKKYAPDVNQGIPKMRRSELSLYLGLDFSVLAPTLARKDGARS